MVQQTSIWLISLLLMLGITATFIFVYRKSSVRQPDYQPLQNRAYAIRTVFFLVLMFVLIPIGLYLLTDLPYPTADARTSADSVVDVTGYQWRWEMSQTEFQTGQTVLFRVRSADVNHGFGLYDSDLRLLGQVQAMPGFVNEMVHTFERPGNYKVLCMEYCGTAHHAMIMDITVSD